MRSWSVHQVRNACASPFFHSHLQHSWASAWATHLRLSAYRQFVLDDPLRWARRAVDVFTVAIVWPRLAVTHWLLGRNARRSKGDDVECATVLGLGNDATHNAPPRDGDLSDGLGNHAGLSFQDLAGSLSSWLMFRALAPERQRAHLRALPRPFSGAESAMHHVTEGYMLVGPILEEKHALRPHEDLDRRRMPQDVIESQRVHQV